MKLGKILKVKREEKGLTLEEIARICGVSPSFISLIESGKRIPDVELTYHLSGILAIPFLFLLNLLAYETYDEKVKEVVAKIRLRNLFPFDFTELPKQSLFEMISYINEKYPKRYEDLYKQAIEKHPEWQNLETNKAIAQYFKIEPSIKEVLYKNTFEENNFYNENLLPVEKIKRIKDVFSFTWDELAGITGKTPRSLQRYVAGKIEIPRKVAKKVDEIYERMFLRIGPMLKSQSTERIFRKIEDTGLAEEIKKRFIKMHPQLKSFKNKPLSIFLYELSKYGDVEEKVRKNMSDGYFSRSPRERRCINHEAIILQKGKKVSDTIRIDRRKKQNTGREKRQKKNKETRGTSEDGADGESDDEDGYWFKIEKRRYIIGKKVELLFENWVEKIKTGNMLAGSGGDLRKEVSMKIRKRKGSPYYYIDICLNGTRLRQSTHTSNKTEAKRIASQMLSKILSMQHSDFPVDIPTFENASKNFVTYQKNKGLRSWERELLCHRYLAPYLRNMKVNEIRPKIIQETLTRIKIRKNLSLRSIDYIRGYLHRFFEYERKIEEHIKDNPVDMVERIKYDNTRKIVLEISQQKPFLDNLNDPVVKDAVIFILFTGLRLGELLNLKKSNFRKTGDILYFSIQREKTPEVVTEFPLVWNIPRKIAEKYLSLPAGINLFCYENGRTLDKYNFIYRIKKAVKKAGIGKLCCNDLRRTFCTRMRLAGCDYELREYLMGHKIPGSASHYSIYNVQNIAKHLVNLKEKVAQIWHTQDFER